MKGYSLLFYLLTILLNVVIFFPVVYSFGILAPVHLLIFYLSFSSLLERSGFDSSWGIRSFSIIPSFVLLFVILGLLGAGSDNFREYIKLLIEAPILPLITFGVSILEFIILYRIYSKFTQKKNSSGNSDIQYR